MTTVLNYGRTFFDHTGGENEVRMPIDSRVIITDPSAVEHTFYGVREHFGENTNVQTGLFKDPSYDFRPVLGDGGELFFRRWAAYDNVVNPYKEYRPVLASPWWGVRVPIVPEVSADVLTTFAQIRAASHAGRPLVARVSLPAVNGYSAIIEHQVNSISLYTGDGRWQVNAGPVPFPRFDEIAPNLIQNLDLAFVTYNRLDYVEFLMENSCDVGGGKKVIHFNTYLARTAVVALLAV